jgi:AcrR family transcriptional regulator
MDARQRRSQQRLYAAVLRLAERTPIGDVSVTAVAESAGVHRSTFYEHAASPGDLLRAALTAELDEARERLLAHPDADVVTAIERTTVAVADHLQRHAAIYRRGLAPDAGPGSLVTMLAEHFQRSGRLLVEQGRVRVLVTAPATAQDVTVEAGLGFIAFGTVGAARAWLAQPEPRDPAEFLALVEALQPDWWGRR